MGGVAGVLSAALALGPVRAPAQSLDDASAAALAASFTLRADQARQEGAEARLRGSLDAFLPTVSLLADQPLQSRFTYRPQLAPPTVGLDTTPRGAPAQLGLVADLPLLDGLRRYHTFQSARALAEAGRNLTLDRRQQVLLDTATAYLAVLRDTQIAGFRNSEISAIGRIRDDTQRRFEVQDATRTDVALTRSRVQAAEAARDRALADLAASRREFIRLVRMEPERMTPPRFPDILPKSEDAYADLVRAANPALAAARLDAKSARFVADAQVADLLPTLNLQFTRATQFGYSPALDRITDTTTRLVARVPIVEPGALPRIGEASALARQRGYETQDQELTTLTNARTAFARHKAVADQLQRLAARVAALRDTLRGFEIERGAGFRTILDELNLRAELADAEAIAATVAAERDGLTFTLAAAAGLLEVGRTTRASRPLQAIPALGKAVPAQVAARTEPALRGSGGTARSATPPASPASPPASPPALRGSGGTAPASAPSPDAAPTLRPGEDSPAAPGWTDPAPPLRGTGAGPAPSARGPSAPAAVPTLRVSRAEVAGAPL